MARRRRSIHLIAIAVDLLRPQTAQHARAPGVGVSCSGRVGGREATAASTEHAKSYRGWGPSTRPPPVLRYGWGPG
ncbi:hypothetical protein EDB80DRAFT_402282 [Ilyonectria destructans]|nr:hypothetical protein EDB80DRAFT_402282 [Ilyonectria destructans]